MNPTRAFSWYLFRYNRTGNSRMTGKKQFLFAILLVLSFFSLSSAWVWAQAGGGGGSGGGSGAGGGGQSGDSTRPAVQSGSQADRQRLMYLSGRVLLDDGQEPGQRTQVELLCQGSVVRQEYTSGSGIFSIEIAGSTQASSRSVDASVSSSNSQQLGGGFGGGSGGATGLGAGGGLLHQGVRST